MGVGWARGECVPLFSTRVTDASMIVSLPSPFTIHQNPFMGLAPAELAMAETAMKQIMMMGAPAMGAAGLVPPAPPMAAAPPPAPAMAPPPPMASSHT